MTSKRIRISLSVTEQTHRLLKEKAKAKGSNVSQVVSDWIWADSGGRPKRMTEIKLKGDTYERLLDFAYEHHTTPDQAVSDWIWKAKVSDSVIRGQMSMFS